MLTLHYDDDSDFSHRFSRCTDGRVLFVKYVLKLALRDTIANLDDMLRKLTTTDLGLPLLDKRAKNSANVALSNHLNAFTIGLATCSVVTPEHVTRKA